MKNIKSWLIIFIGVILLMPNIVFAATGSVSVTSANTGVVGNNLSVSFTLSSQAALIGRWEFDISYDSAYLQMTSNPSTGSSKDLSSGKWIKGYADNGKGYKSITYTATFKVLKSGSTTIKTSGAVVSDYDENDMSITTGSKTVTLKTQAEIEASYSSDAYLKSLSVGDYTLSPEFNKETYEYNVEVPNDVERVTISAAKNDYNATVSGTGEKELVEGNNKFEVVVTAQKGNSLTYVVNVDRKELNPIKITINSKDYTIVRKKDLLPELAGFVEDTVTYQDTEVPSLYNEALNYRLIGIKDDDGNVYTYIIIDDSNSLKEQYIQLISGELIIYPVNYDESLSGFNTKEINIDGYKLSGPQISEKQIIIKGINPLNNEKNTYLYDIDTKTFIPFNTDILYSLNKNTKVYKLIIILLAVIVILLIGLNIIKKDGKKKKNNKKNNFIVEEFDEIDVEEVKEEPEEIVEEEKNEDDIINEELEDYHEEKRKKDKNKKEEPKEELIIDDEEVEDIKEEPKEEKKLSKRAKKKIKEQEKKEKEEQEQKRLKEAEKQEEINDYDKVDDPLDDEDDFMDFWETREFVVKNKKKDDE